MTQDKQQQFDAQYITSLELRDVLGVSRGRLKILIDTGKLPEPIRVARRSGGSAVISLWHRKDIAHMIKGDK